MIARDSRLVLAGHRIGHAVCCFLCLSVLVSNGTAWALDNAQLFEEHKAAVVKLEITGWLSNGKRSSKPRVGSGFIIYSGKPHTVILTAAHVIGPASEWDQQDGAARRKVRVEVPDDHGKLVVLTANARVHEQNDAQDWAILLVEGEGYSCLEPGDPRSLEPSNLGILIGYEADSKVAVYTEGKVTKTDIERYGFVLRFNMDVIEGQSGGPLLDARGRVVGIASGNERDKRGFHIAVPVSLPIASLDPLLPSSGDCISAERRYHSYLKVAKDYEGLGKKKEYVESLEMLLRNQEVLRKLPDEKRLRAEEQLHFDIGLTLLGEDYIEGIAAPKQRATAHLEQARLLNSENPITLIVLGFGRAAETADRLPDPKSKINEIKNLFAEALKLLKEGKSNARFTEETYYSLIHLYHYWYGRALIVLKDHAGAKAELKAALAVADQYINLPGMALLKDYDLFRLGQNEFNRSHDVSLASYHWKNVSDPELVGHALSLSGLGLWREGQEAKNRGNKEKTTEKFAAAERALSLAKRMGERSFSQSLTLGILYFTRENYVDAAANFEDVIRINPRKALGYYWLGRSKFMIKGAEALTEARDALEQAVKLQPNHSDSHYWYGRVLAELGQNTTAMAEYQESIAIDRANAKAYGPLINVMLRVAEDLDIDRRKRMSLYEDALRYADAVTKSESTKDALQLKTIRQLQCLIWNNLAYAYAEQGDLPLAKEYIDRAVSAEPDNAYYLDTTAWILIRSTELSKTLSHEQQEEKLSLAKHKLNKALESLPQEDTNALAEVNFHLGYVEKLQGRNEAARGLFLKAIDLNPGYQKAKEALNN